MSIKTSLNMSNIEHIKQSSSEDLCLCFIREQECYKSLTKNGDNLLLFHFHSHS